jgi:uncharacterized HAD superfamily protein
MLALELNLPLTDIDGLSRSDILKAGSTRRRSNWVKCVAEAKHILVVDDSIASGAAMRGVKLAVGKLNLGSRITFAAAYAAENSHSQVDIAFDVCPVPRIFGWNYLNHPIISNSCVDIDGVLCRDPLDSENDDGENYTTFLRSVKPLRRPTYEIGYLVTTRLEKYRRLTENWLAEHGIKHKKLFMLNGITASERQALGQHGRFKGILYASLPAELFIESDEDQARMIALISGKLALCATTQHLVNPSPFSAQTMIQNLRRQVRRARSKVHRSWR